MNIIGKMLSLLGASCLMAFATAAPASAKPCCYNNGEYFESTPSTCHRYGGRLVDYRYCSRGSYGGRYYDRSYDDRDVTFEVGIGDIVIAFSDGYYDRSNRWHGWRSDRHRDWYKRHHGNKYRGWRRDDDREWRGRRR